MVLQFSFANLSWIQVTGSSFPPHRTDHSTILVNDSLYVFGGRVVDALFNDLWQYNLTTQSWTQITTSISSKPIFQFRRLRLLPNPL